MAEKDEKAAPAAKEETKPEGEQPKFMTAEDFNRASTARESRLKKELEGMFSTFAESLNAKPAAALEPSEDEDADVDETVTAEASTKTETKTTPTKLEIQIKKAHARAKALEQQSKADKASAAKEKAELLAKEERTMTTAALTAAGVTVPKAALALLKDDKRIGRNKDGDLVFLMPRDIGGEKFDEEMSIEAGVREWLDTDDGKLYRAPKGVEGSGATAERPGRTRRTLSKAETRLEASKTLANYFSGVRGG